LSEGEKKMEAFESFVALSMSKEGLVVSGPLKFMIKKKTKACILGQQINDTINSTQQLMEDREPSARRGEALRELIAS
jgi:hypothetical protein